jgi:hypothetical protein
MGQLAGHPYVTRAQWRARPPTSEFVSVSSMPTPRLWIHHSGTEQHGPAALRDIQRYHQKTKGWKDIAYSFLVDDDGTIYEGRGVGIAGGATAGDNSRSHAICLLGNFETRPVTPAAWRTLVDLARHGRNAGWWKPTCGGHRDAPGASTDCPGRYLYARLPDLRSEIVSGPAVEPEPIPEPEEPDMLIVDSDGRPALALGVGGVKRLSPAQRNALRSAGIEPVKLTPAESDALWSLRDVAPSAVVDLPALADAIADEFGDLADVTEIEAIVRRVFADAADTDG